MSGILRIPSHVRRTKPALRLCAGTAVAGLAAFAALSAQAAEGANVAAAFGNTVLSTYADGASQKVWLRPDGRWDGLSRRNDPLAGTWSVRDDKLCLRQSKPPTLPVAYCTALPATARPGVQWTGRDLGGRAITLSLIKGVPTQYLDAEQAGR